MESILARVEGPSTSEITSFDQIDQTVFQYMNKDHGEKKSLILKCITTW